MDIILGSSSPRRKDILSYFSIPFKVETSYFEEESVEFNGDPGKYVEKIAKGKGSQLIKLFPDSLIITADTTVYFQNQVYNKPNSEKEAFDSLKTLAGSTHQIFTGVCITTKEKQLSSSEITQIEFYPLTDQEIRMYQLAMHTSDKAGGYAVQGAGYLIVKRMEGCYMNAMGLPIGTLSTLLKEFGVDLWRYL